MSAALAWLGLSNSVQTAGSTESGLGRFFGGEGLMPLVDERVRLSGLDDESAAESLVRGRSAVEEDGSGE